MSRKSKKQTEAGTITLAAAGKELALRLVKVYKSQSYVRSGQELAELLLKTGVEAGAALTGIAELPTRQAKIEAANNAIIKLNQVSYFVDVMCMAEIYKPEQVKNLVQYIGHVINALRNLLASVPEIQRVVRIKTPLGVVDTSPARKQPVVLINASAPVGVVTSPVANIPESSLSTQNAQVVQNVKVPSAGVQIIQPTASDDGFDDLV